MEQNKHIKILYGLVLLLLAGMAVILYQSQKGSVSIGHNQVLPAAATSTPNLSGIVVGGGGPTLLNVVGTISALGASSMQVKVFNQDKVDNVVIGAGTKFEMIGPPKDSATVQKDLTAYNAQVDVLMKDPIKNKAALAAMQIPPSNTIIPATLNDFKVGDQVLVAASSVNASGAYVATIISKTAAQ